MRLASVVALAVVAAVPADAVAARKVGAPTTLRQIGAGEPLSHPSAPHQTWELSGIDRRSGRAAMVRLSTNPELDSEVRAGTPGEVAGAVPGAALGGAMRLTAASGRSLRLDSALGSARIARAGSRLVVEIDSQAASGRLVLSRITRGPLARRWSLGRLTLDDRRVSQHLSLAVPALTARLDGELTIDGTPLRIRGWRGSLEHVWGDLSYSPRAWDGWNAVTLHGSRRSAWLAYGLTRSDVTAYDGAIDGQWLGVLAHARAGQVRLCRPAVHRRPNAGIDVTVIRLRCWGRRITLRMRPGRAFLWSYVNLNDGRDWDELGRLARGPGGAVGVARILDPTPLFPGL